MPPARTARSTQRTRRLLDAAVVVTAEKGLRGLTHRAVDAQAGLPEGSCSAYLRTRLALLTALTEHVIGTLHDQIAELAASLDEHPGDADLAAARTAAMFRSWLDHPERLLCRLELTVEAQRTPAIASRADASREELVRLVTPLVDRLLSPAGDRSRVAEALVASLDGVLLGALRLPEQERAHFLDVSLDLLLGSGRPGPSSSGAASG